MDKFVVYITYRDFDDKKRIKQEFNCSCLPDVLNIILAYYFIGDILSIKVYSRKIKNDKL